MPPKVNKEAAPTRRGEAAKETSGEVKTKKGWGPLAQQKAEIEESKDAKKPFDFFLKDDGDTAIIQFLTDEPVCVDGHSVIVGANKKYQFVPCSLATQRHCPMCSVGIKLSTNYVFKIADYRGEWDKEKKVYKNDKPIERLWWAGFKVANILKEFSDKKNKNLSEMVLEVGRVGTGTATVYTVERAMDAEDALLKPKAIKSEWGAVEEYTKPWEDAKLEKLGFSSAN